MTNVSCCLLPGNPTSGLAAIRKRPLSISIGESDEDVDTRVSMSSSSSSSHDEEVLAITVAGNSGKMRQVVKATCFQQNTLNTEKQQQPNGTLRSGSPLSALVQFSIRAASSALHKIVEDVVSTCCASSDAASLYLTKFDAAVVKIRDFVRLLPGFQYISIPDRCALFAEAAIPVFVAQMCFSNRPEFAFFAMNQTEKESFLKSYPQFSALDDEIKSLAEAITSWNPTIAEWSLFQAVVFFREPSRLSMNQLENSELIQRLHRHYKSALFDFQVNKLNDNFNLRLRHFVRVYDLLSSFTASHSNLLAQLKLCSCSCPSSTTSSISSQTNTTGRMTESMSVPAAAVVTLASTNDDRLISSTNSSDNNNNNSVKTFSKFFHEIFCNRQLPRLPLPSVSLMSSFSSSSSSPPASSTTLTTSSSSLSSSSWSSPCVNRMHVVVRR